MIAIFRFVNARDADSKAIVTFNQTMSNEPEQIKIDSDIPMPEKNSTILSATLKKLEIGQSFVFKRKSLANLHASAKQIGIKISTRKQDDNGLVRIWRIA